MQSTQSTVCCLKKEAKIILKSRNNRIINDGYPEIVAATQKMDLPDCILDGEKD